jgi:uncharacterized hydrophobic protein (TIGR00271 family)
MMTEENTQPNQPANQPEADDKSIGGILKNFSDFLRQLLDIREDSDRSETVESVRKDINFKGHNAWILIFSIMVASVGLNANSPAVVIGAMLISPLMGPIVGVGLGTAINDGRMLRRSITNMLVMVILSVITSSIYFAITPLQEMGSELAARTEPTILDVLVAIFGGLALIVAKAKKGTISNAIAGVAIGTALMPPLCTAGYGFATGQWLKLAGALYLFFINSVFIALATFLVCKFLRFPMVKYANAKQRKRVNRIATALGILVLIPSIYLFYNLYTETKYVSQARKFVNEVVTHPGTRAQADWNHEDKKLEVILLGRQVPQPTLDDWTYKFNSEETFEDCKIEFLQNSYTVISDNDEDVERLQEERINDIKLIQNKDQRIAALERELEFTMASFKNLKVLAQEAEYLYPEISAISYAPVVGRNQLTKAFDTVDVFTITYADTLIPQNQKSQIAARMQSWLKFRMDSEKVEVKEFSESIVPSDTTKPNVQPVKIKNP